MDYKIIHLKREQLKKEQSENTCAWGVLMQGEVVAAIETAPEEQSNCLWVTELWVAPKYQRKGIGHRLMAVAKEQARLERRKAVIVETQWDNENAIAFFLQEVFIRIEQDRDHEAGKALEMKESCVRMGYFLKRKKRLTPKEVEIRKEEPADYHAVERLTQEAFWNKHTKGCNEHYLVHVLRESSDYLPELSRIAVVDGEIVGTIMYSRSWVKDGEKLHEVTTFGPLCVKPEWHGCGIGEMLLKETMQLAKEAGYPGIIIFGEPDYYPRIGFKTCDHFGITTPDGKNFDAFMGVELRSEGMKDIHGKFYEAEVFEKLSEADAEEYNKHFDALEKQYFPMQWD